MPKFESWSIELMAIQYSKQFPWLGPAGDSGIIIYFSEEPSPEVLSKIQATVELLENSLSDFLIDMVPSYASLLVFYDPLKITYSELHDKIQSLLKSDINGGINSDRNAGNLVTLPVYYSQESGPDLERLAQYANLSIQQLINLHQQQDYRVYAIGFAPGFAYLGELDPAIACPRLATPRAKVPRGAVAIADRQTAVYPATSPGGWNLIGLCPEPLFTPGKEPPMPFQVGDTVKFESINREQFLQLGGDLSEMADLQ